MQSDITVRSEQAQPSARACAKAGEKEDLRQRPHTPSLKQQLRIASDILADPAGCEGAQDVSVRDYEDV